MKTQTITTHLGKVMLVEVEKNATKINLHQHGEDVAICYGEGLDVRCEIVSENDYARNFKLLGLITDSIPKFDCSFLLEKDKVNGLYLIHDSANTIDTWVNNSGQLGSITRTDYGSATDSFLSLLRSQGVLLENKYGEEKPNYHKFNTPSETLDMLWEQDEKLVWKKIACLLIKTQI